MHCELTWVQVLLPFFQLLLQISFTHLKARCNNKFNSIPTQLQIVSSGYFNSRHAIFRNLRQLWCFLLMLYIRKKRRRALRLNWIWEQDEEMGSEILCPVSLQCFWQECTICRSSVIACQLGSQFRSSRKEKGHRYSNPVTQTQELISNAHRYRVYMYLVCIWFCFSQTFSMA